MAPTKALQPPSCILNGWSLISCLFISESKSSFITSSASSLITISMLSLTECITRCSSLSMKEIKLFAIIHMSDFLRLFMMSFKSGLILLRYSSTDSVTINVTFVFNIIATAKMTYSYWFIIILFFFMLKKILNISKYSIFNCFSFFF